jgi:hypothetical protein
VLSPTPTLLLPSAAAPDASLSLPAYLAVVVVIAVGVRWLAWAVRVPSLLLLLPAGFALGQVVTPDTVMGRDVVSAAASVGVVVAVGFSVPVGFALGAAVRRTGSPTTSRASCSSPWPSRLSSGRTSSPTKPAC